MQDLPAQRRAGAHPAAPSSPARPAGSAPVGSAAATAPPPEASTTLPAAPQAAAESTRPAAGLSGTPQPADTATTEAGLPAERSLRDNAAAARQRADGLALTHNKAAEAADTPRQAALAKALTGRPRPVPGNSLLAAVVRGDIESARQWLAAAGPDAGQDGDGRSALALAVLRADLAMVRLLLAHGADRLARDRFGQTPQGYAAAQADPALRTAFDLP